MAKKFKNPPKIKVKLPKITDTRKKQLKRVKGIISRLEKRGYTVDVDVESLSTQKLIHLDRKKIIQQYGTYEETEEDKALKARKRILRAQKRRLASIRKRQQGKVISIDEAKKQDANWKAGDTYKTIPAGSDAKIQVDLIIKQIEEGENYRGKRASSEGLIQMSAGRLRVIFEEARRKYEDEEIVNRLEQTFGSMEKCSAVIERLIYAVYDDMLAEWADGVTAYEHLLSTVVGALGVTDPGF